MWTRRRFMAASAVGVFARLRAEPSQSGTSQRTTWTLPAKQSFRVVENTWIAMQDGVRLGARLWIPSSAEHTPVPVVWEYIPYRKRDRERGRDDEWAAAFVPYGFAYARVDTRGSGDSEGILLDEYLQQEQDDAVEVIAWLARQKWSNGAVGMRGISWGGFSALQAAARAPPALKAIMAHCASDNRYTDDSHYIGGAVALDEFDWGAEFKNDLVAPPDPAIVGPRWHDMWLQRLRAAQPVLAGWLTHQRYDSYWQHGSIAMDYAAMKCPVYVVGGQVDSYRDFIPRTLQHLRVPRKGLMGPWGHRYPDIADPGPGLDWVMEEVRWWTQWLRGIDTGIMNEPMLRVYMEEKTAAQVWPRDTPGRWIAEPSWPAPDVVPKVLFLNADGLGSHSMPGGTLICKSQETLGLTKREWFPWNMSIDLPPDQTADDKRSLLFDTQPLDADFEILGKPTLKIRLTSNQPIAKLAVRLNEVLASGESWSVTYGLLNLTHRDSHTHPSPLDVGRAYEIEIPLYFTAHRFKKGSRIRLAVSESLWPMVWPSPLPVELRFTAGEPALTLPVRPVSADPPMPIAMLRGKVEAQAKADRDIADKYSLTQTGPDAEGHVMLHKALRDFPETIAATGTTVSGGSDWYMSIKEGDPNSGTWRFEWFSTLTRGAWNTTTRSTLELTSTPTEFHIKESITALEAQKVVFEKAWDNRIKRDLV